jgi:glycerol-3-phosphate dehydrogenase
MTTPVPSPPFAERAEWRRLLDAHYDLLVVGGGIHGVGVARDAALRGLRVALIERNDWGSGSSSRSSKLIHGGLRYLRQGQFGLVREALAERELLLRLAPSLVSPLRFQVAPPLPGTTPLWQVRAGIGLYGILSGRLRSSRWWDRAPSYEDAAVEDARFCLAVMLDARRRGALALSRVEWLEWARSGNRIAGARVRDRLSGEEGWVSAGAFVNAAGPWADLLLAGRGRASALRLTRGTHVVLDRAPGDGARLFFAPQDGRVLFLLPYGERYSLLGTTDLDEGTPTWEPLPRPEEIRYLQHAFQHQFPRWAHWRPVGVHCGLRPLLAGEGQPSDLSREERVDLDPSRSLVSILGGKYTTYRAAAERAVDLVEEALGRNPGERPTRSVPLPGFEGGDDPGERIRAAFAGEDAVRLEDVFYRRTALGHRGRVEEDLLRRAAKLWRLRWGKGEREAEAEIEAFRAQEMRRADALSSWKG